MYPDVSSCVANLARRLRSRVGAVSSHDKSSAQDIEAGCEDKLENGLLGIANLCQRDVMFMVTPRLTSQSMYLLHTGAVHLRELWKELEHATLSNSDRLAETWNNYNRHHMEHLQLVQLTKETAKLRPPPEKFFNGFKALLAHYLHGREAALHTGPPDDWAMLHDLDLPDIWVRNAAEYGWVEFVLKFGSKIKREGGVTSMEYPIGVLFTIVYSLFSCVMAAFLGVPVALQALDVTSPKAYVGAYIAFLFVFSVIIQLSMPGCYAMQLVLSLAYAAVLVANMKNSDT